MRRPDSTPSGSDRTGVGPAEVLVIILVIGVLILLLMMGLTRSREAARSVTCTRNLHQIGLALGLYEQATRRLPAVPLLDGTEPPRSGPIAEMLQQLGVTDLTALAPDSPPPPPSGEPPLEGYLPGVVCPSDRMATARVFPAPVSYRANAGIGPDGRLGPFSPGERVTTQEVEAGHGASYTASFAERLVGSAGTAKERIRDYQVVPGPIPEAGCPDLPSSPLLTDAGRSWLELGWRSTLYSHALPPASASSCIAEDGRSAFMGASSGHVEGIRILLMDGSVRTYARSVAPAVWRALGSYRDEDSPEAPVPDESALEPSETVPEPN
ncbi:DUF1559 family PulG-like putative transporter [Tautonia sociabilis]|uniref:DUF1559 domain-containing protein n=1 Tax=Tautonia sociabilis TaxID=2080755 RepID=A0A432MJQ6_9BACT|nr:DUF1559 domain-containing protein [Tautonia sociabilis]RUL87356.1 DUF1559 domain-containing protein [Tautonia sociabilis]